MLLVFKYLQKHEGTRDPDAKIFNHDVGMEFDNEK